MFGGCFVCLGVGGGVYIKRGEGVWGVGGYEFIGVVLGVGGGGGLVGIKIFG